MASRLTSGMFLSILVLVAFHTCLCVDRDLEGDYCGNRPSANGQCCDGRQDDCSRPILGTLCYCDDFCNRTAFDCCPDYAPVCLGIVVPQSPKKNCYLDGTYYTNGEKFTVNCNDCMCQEMNDHMEILCEQNQCLVDPEVIHNVNRETRRFGWRASNYSMFWGKTLQAGLQRGLGTINARRKVLSMTPLKQIIRKSEIPPSFDARTNWKGLISSPKDQNWCGSSWVFSTVGVASDRWAIMTKGRVNQQLSAQHLLSCNSKAQKGCNGGYLSKAWVFIKKFGLVTEGCYTWTGDSSRCLITKNRNAQEARCPSKENSVEKTELYRMGPVYRVISEEGIMWEILQSGPVQATMKVNPDFFVYSGGVYKCGPVPSQSQTGFHSVRIVGWGEEMQQGKTVKYWIVANSWGRDWGEQGYFRIRKGVNECRIEDFVLGAWVNLSSRRPTLKDIFLTGNEI